MQVLTRNKFRVSLIFLVLFLIFISKFFLEASAVEDNDFMKKERVQVEVVKFKSFKSTIEYGGFIKGDNQIQLSPRVNGRLVSILKNEGEMVRKGEAVAILRADEISAQSHAIKETISSLYENLEKTEKYYKQKVDEARDNNASKEEISSAKRLRDLQAQAVETEIIRAKGGLNEAQGISSELVVRAPFDGIVLNLNAEIGELVGPAVPILELVDNNNLVIEVFVPQTVSEKLKKGELLEVLDKEKNIRFLGEISSVGPISESLGQKALLRISFKENKEFLHLGDYLVLSLPDKENSRALVIKEESVISKYDNHFVYLIEGDLVKERKIEIGEIEKGEVEVLAGLSEGERIVKNGLRKIKNGDKVEVYE